MPLEAYLLSLAEEAAVQAAPTATGQTKREEAVRPCSNLERSTVSRSESPSHGACSTKDTATDGGIRSRRLRRDFVVFSGRSQRRYSLQSPGSKGTGSERRHRTGNLGI